MEKLLIFLTGLTIFLINVALATEIVTHHNTVVHAHDTHNVGHQFYDALIETPKDAMVKGAIATKDLGKEVAATVAVSPATRNLKEATKELVIGAPVKTAHALKNGAIKILDATKSGAATVYRVAIKQPAHAIKESDFVQGTKETFIEVGEQIKEVGYDAYVLAIQRPIGALKAAGHYMAHGDEHEEHSHSDHLREYRTYVIIVDTQVSDSEAVALAQEVMSAIPDNIHKE